MIRKLSGLLAIVFCMVVLGCNVAQTASDDVPSELMLAAEPTPVDPSRTKTAVFAGGCFWGVEAVFEHVKGVVDARSGYAGGVEKMAKYELVGMGDTGHAESVEVVFDPAVVSYEQLLAIFFSVAHDPTQLNRQGPDVGTQYRSAILYKDGEQKIAALGFVKKLTAEKRFRRPIVTEVAELKGFYPAEDYHQDYLKLHPNEPYIVVNDQPKIVALKKQFPERYVER